MDYSTKTHVKKARKEVKHLLRMNGLPTKYTLRVKELGPDVIGMYRGGSVLRGNMIFWLSSNFSALSEEAERYQWNQDSLSAEITTQIARTILHEYGHAVAELIRLSFRRVDSPYRGMTFEQDVCMDEEHFAESMFMRSVLNHTVEHQPWFKFIQQFI